MESVITHCILCNSTSLKPLSAYRNHHLCRCSSCGLIFSQHNPDSHQLKEFYKQYSYDEYYYISPITLKRYREILSSLEKYRKLNRILDVGCGNGIFLSVAKEMGWECYGTEYSEKAVELCRKQGLSVLHGSLSDVYRQLPEVDVIISIEVLEHINTPNEELSLFFALLRTGGVVYITTPNFNGLLRPILKEKYDIIAYPEHLTYYTPKTLRKAFRNHHFRPLWVKTTGISVSRLKNALNKVGVKHENPYTATSSDESLRELSETKWFMGGLKKIVNGILSITGTGLTIKGIFVKQSSPDSIHTF